MNQKTEKNTTNASEKLHPTYERDAQRNFDNPRDDEFVTRGELRRELTLLRNDIKTDIKTLFDERLPPKTQ